MITVMRAKMTKIQKNEEENKKNFESFQFTHFHQHFCPDIRIFSTQSWATNHSGAPYVAKEAMVIFFLRFGLWSNSTVFESYYPCNFVAMIASAAAVAALPSIMALTAPAEMVAYHCNCLRPVWLWRIECHVVTSSIPKLCKECLCIFLTSLASMTIAQRLFFITGSGSSI
jgi:hypothetical protein